MIQNLLGPYGEYFADKCLGVEAGKISVRRIGCSDSTEWRALARKKLLECMAPVDLGNTPKVSIDEIIEYDGLSIERLSWQLPFGPRTEAVFMKPLGEKNPLPGVLGLHDHGGNKFIGWHKIARINDAPWEIQLRTQNRCYEGKPWANELAKRGYAVLVHDTFSFGSRKVKVAEVPEHIRGNAIDSEPTDIDEVEKYIRFAGGHENILMKGLLCSGTTFPGVYVMEDQMALNILSERVDVDENRLGCGGLSGGGMRTVYLTGIDDRIKCAVPSGFMTTWKDFILNKSSKHTWMAYLPLFPAFLDFSEILMINNNAGILVLNCNEDPLFSIDEMHRADEIIKESFRILGESNRYQCHFHPGVHKFDLKMQEEAFDWFDKFLNG